ncbi:MAG: hypothetical protein QW291_00350 [Thermofilaceae archaeon]
MPPEERLRELLSELVETIKASPDPFKVRVREFLDELAKLLPQADLEELQLDVEVLYRLAEVVQRQEEWLISEAAAFALGRFLAALKARVLSENELAGGFLEAWKPIVELEQVTYTEILDAFKYSEGKRRFMLESGEEELVRLLSLEEVAALGILSEKRLMNLLEEVRDKLNTLLSGRDIVKYSEAVRGENFYETYMQAYALSYLSTLGEFDVLYDPFSNEFYVARAGVEGEFSSVAIHLKKVVNDAS